MSMFLYVRVSPVRWLPLWFSVFCLVGTTSTANAQTDVTNRQFVRNLFFLPPLDSQETLPGTSQSIAESASNSADEIAKFVGFGISSVPLGSSSAGFSYARDEVTGAMSLKTRTFGPLLGERPLTNGRGVLSFGFNYQRTKTNYSQDFNTEDGRDTGIPIFDNGVTFLADGFHQYVTRRVFLESKVDTYSFFGSVGLTDRIDLGVTVPVLSIRLTGETNEGYDISRTFAGVTERAAFERNYRGVPVGILPIPVPSNPGPTQSARGIGDIIVRGKVSLSSQQNGEGTAVAIDVSLPTGDADEFLGRGETTTRLMLLASKAIGSRASAYGNGGYRFGKDNNEAQYLAGLEVSVLPRDRLTVAVSFLGRSMRDASSLTRIPTVRRVSTNLGINEGEPSSVELDRFFWSRSTMNLNRLSTEFKLHVAGQWLATGALLFPLTEKGMQPGLVPFIGLEWAGGQ